MPYMYNDRKVTTTAKSSKQALSFMMNNIRKDAPPMVKQEVIYNDVLFTAIPWDEYEASKITKPLPEIPNIKRREDPQMKLFPDPYNPPE